MPGVLVVIGKVLATKIIAGITIKAVVIAAIKVAASYAISRALSKGSKGKSGGLGSGAGSELVMSRDPSPARRVVYGQTRVSGPMAFCHVSGIDNANISYVILLAGHECDQIGAYLVDDVQVATDASGNVTSGTFAGKMNIVAYMGDQVAADAAMVTATGGAWASNCTLRGIAYLAVRLTYDPQIYSSGLPNISVILRGKKEYDPRTTTTTFSRNPTLILRDYLLDSDFGLGATTDEIDDASFIAAANICDEGVTLSVGGTEPRYRCDGTFTTDAEPAAIIEQILATMGGSLVYAGGKFRCSAGAYFSPTVTLDEGDLRGPIQYQTASGIREVCNIAKGTYTSPADLYQPRDFPQFRDSAHVTADGEEIPTDLDLSWVSSASQAQRLAKTYERQSRLGGTITLQCNLSAMRVQAGDTIAISNTRFGWAPKVFIVQEFRFSMDPGGALGVDLTCRETSPSVYGWTAGSDEQIVTPGLTIQNPNGNGSRLVVGTLNNDSATIPSAADGSSPVLGPAETTISIYTNGGDDSDNWTYTAAPSSGVTGTLSGRTWTTTGFTVDAGFVDITGSKSGVSSVTVRFTLAKARAGAAGSNGSNGLNSAVVFLFQRTATSTPPTTPSVSSNYTFSSGVLTGYNNGWAQSMPTTGGIYRWQTTASALSATSTDDIAAGEWSTPAISSQDGTNGLDGTSPTAYWLVVAAAAIQKSQAGAYTPASLAILARSQTGSATPANYAGRFIIAESTDGSSYSNVYTSGGDESSTSRTPSAGIKSIRVRLYLDGGTATLLDEEIIPVVSDGADGQDGESYSGSYVSGGGTVGNTPWTTPTGMSITVSLPAGPRLIQFNGSYVNSGGGNSGIQTLYYAIRVDGSNIATGSVSTTSMGQSFALDIAGGMNRATAGTSTIEVVGYAGVNSATLSGHFVVT